MYMYMDMVLEVHYKINDHDGLCITADGDAGDAVLADGASVAQRCRSVHQKVLAFLTFSNGAVLCTDETSPAPLQHIQR